MDRTLNLISGLINLVRAPKHDEDDAHPSLRFHTTHGSNIFLNESRSLVSRISSYNNGIVFSDRIVQLNEIVPVKILETRKYKGPLFFGFTTIDPGTLRTNEVGMLHDSIYTNSVWLKSLNDHQMEINTTLCYKVLPNAVIKYSVNGVGFETHLRGLRMNSPLWAIFHVYGSVGGIKLVHSPVEDIPEPELGNEDESFNLASLGLNGYEPEPPPNNASPFSPVSRVFSHSSTPIRNSTEMPQFRTPPNTPTSDYGEFGFRTPLTPTPNENQFQECIICVDNIATMALVSCGHMCLCHDCASRFLDNPCPICRQPVNDILRIYYP